MTPLPLKPGLAGVLDALHQMDFRNLAISFGGAGSWGVGWRTGFCTAEDMVLLHHIAGRHQARLAYHGGEWSISSV